ncbi:MAG: DUF177 domain-containing protein [Alphaproteobacteria bacterium]|nr:DUF177 domain-containing protein [Alphaproteobacteria bacterium]
MLSLTTTINIDTLTRDPFDISLKATAEERATIQKRLSVISIENIEAKLHLRRKGLIFLKGMIQADITVECVRTLVAFQQHLKIKVNETFLAPAEDTETPLPEEVEPLEEEILNIGEIVIQLISLNLDPYPVAPNTLPLDYQEEKLSTSPFEVLKKEK